jgi:hypothetical protein
MQSAALIVLGGIAAFFMAYAFLGLAAAQSRNKRAAAVGISVASVCGFSILVALLA